MFALKEELRNICYGTKKKEHRKESGSFGCIGVIDVHEGAESGAFCTLLAAYINDREKGRIACIDMSGRHIFEQLYESMFGGQKTIPDSFLLQGICYVPEGDKGCIGSYKAKGYTTLILCFGEPKGHLCEEFLCCDRRFAVGVLFPWRLQAWNWFSECLEGEGVKQNVTAVLTGGEKELLPIRFGKVIELSYIGDALLPDKQTEKIIRSVV